jgi:hypothetical protein
MEPKGVAAVDEGRLLGAPNHSASFTRRKTNQSPTWIAAVVGSSMFVAGSLIWRNNNSSRIVACQQRAPPKFGTSIRSLSSSSSSTGSGSAAAAGPPKKSEEDDDEEECPICKKYSQGPCGETFKAWLKCTDANPGKDDEGEDKHLSKCAHLAAPLADCLNQHEAYYENQSFAQDLYQDNEKEEDLKTAWQEFIDNVQESRPTAKFPSKKMTPRVQVRLESKMGMVQFASFNDKQQSILMGYVQNSETGQLLSAGSKDDMISIPISEENKDETVALRFDVPDGLNKITLCAIYDNESPNTKKDDELPIYKKNLSMPTQSKK